MDARFPSSPWHGLTSRLSWKKLTWKKFLTVLIKPKLLPFMFRGELAVFTCFVVSPQTLLKLWLAPVFSKFIMDSKTFSNFGCDSLVVKVVPWSCVPSLLKLLYFDHWDLQDFSIWLKSLLSKLYFQVWIFWIFGRSQEKDTGCCSEKQQAIHFTGKKGAGKSKFNQVMLLV